jgi:hypothetical protein
MSASNGQRDGYQANTNQARDEPLPASHDEEHGQEAVVRSEEHAAGARQEHAASARSPRKVRGRGPGGRHRK